MIRPEPLYFDERAEPEGDGLPASLAGIEVVDAHVHLFPDGLFDAIWRWFDANAWPIRYRLHSDAVLDLLEMRGVRRVVALHYAHRPGMAAALNEYVLAIAKRRPFVVPTATVLPGEPGAREILRRALGEGARGIKIHCHVQKVAPDEARMDEVYEEAIRASVPLVMHAGREPASDAYGVDCHSLCSAEKVERALVRHPGLKLIVPHLGVDEVEAYDAMLDRWPGLMLDTTMMVAGYFPGPLPTELLARRASRLLYGTDFPHIPYAWDRELKRIAAAGLSREALAALLGANARRIFATIA